jgi:hypothetical protein
MMGERDAAGPGARVVRLAGLPLRRFFAGLLAAANSASIRNPPGCPTR